MDRTLTLVIYMAIITWLLSLLASLIRVKAWTLQGTLLALGNRESMPAATPFAGRAERTARNTGEAFVLFAAIALVAHVAAVHSPQIESGANIFFYARLLYIPLYYAGIAYLRTAVWGAGVAGLGMMVAALL